MNLNRVDEWLATHYAETDEGLVDSPPSALRRGEGTEKPFYIMKVDLVGSTLLLRSKRQSTYLRLAHTFLSTVDRITQHHGADGEQVEYAGDGVMAYFPVRADAAEQVLKAAFYVHAAVARISRLGGAVGALKPQCRMVLHYAPLTVARIGPRSSSVLSAIGWPLHHVSKIEKEIPAGTGRATKEFYLQLVRENRKFLNAVYLTKEVLAPAPPPIQPFSFSPSSVASGGLLGLRTPPASAPAPQLGMQNLLAGLLRDQTSSPPPLPPPHASLVFQTQQELIGYDIDWGKLATVLK